jgi:hypothetical protein
VEKNTHPAPVSIRVGYGCHPRVKNRPRTYTRWVEYPTGIGYLYPNCYPHFVHAFRPLHALYNGRQFNESPEFGILYSVSSSLDLVRFFDADFVGCEIDQKSTSNTCHFLRSSLVCWSARKQSSIAQSTKEVEYIAATPKYFG